MRRPFSAVTEITGANVSPTCSIAAAISSSVRTRTFRASVAGRNSSPNVADAEALPNDYLERLNEVSTRALASAAFPTPADWQRAFHRDNNMGSRVDWLVKLDARVARGGYVDSEELAEARAEVDAFRRWRRITERWSR
jgi:hypothetical protein